MVGRIFRFLVLAAVGVVAVLPLLNVMNHAPLHWLSPSVVAGVNLTGWALVLTFLFSRHDFQTTVSRIARRLGIDIRFKSLESLLTTVLKEIDRKNRALSMNLIERKIASKEDLSEALDRIVGLAFKLLGAESAELALFNPDSGSYHSSFVLGKPFRISAQALLAGAMEGEIDSQSPEILIQPIAFAGTVLGTLRVGLPRSALPTTGDREIMSLLALQSSLALMNSQFTEELMRMKRSSEETIKAKTGFLANLSHELRGPLGIMLNAVELVLDGLCGDLNDDQLETLQMVRGNGEHLLELINDVLDYAKIESGRVKPNLEVVLVNDVLEDMVGVVRTQADAKNHRLEYKASEEALAINIDRRHFRQMLINLLTNAIKYTPDGGKVEIRAERIPGNKIKIHVSDTGVGIDPADRGKVFSAFERIEHTYSLGQVGTGLGMPLTRRLAQMNGGSIDFDSAPGKGSHFWLVFPVVDGKLDVTTGVAQVVAEPEIRGNNEVVLLVESDDGERAMIGRYLQHKGFKVSATADEAEALDFLRTHDVDLIITDNAFLEHPAGEHRMVEEIRGTARSSLLPVVLLSSRAFVFDIERYLRAGVDRCIIKPAALKKLVTTCRELIDAQRKERELRAAAPKSMSKEEEKRAPLKSKVIRTDEVVH